MYHVVASPAQRRPDVARFIDTLQTLSAHRVAEARDLFDPGRAIVVTRAPARLDLMGGIADYSGSLVLQWPLEAATLVALQRQPARTLRIVSLPPEPGASRRVVDVPLAALEREGQPIDYTHARAYFGRDPAGRWAAYVAGAILVLMRECGAVFPDGARLLVASDVPEGKGIASSAALESAAIAAVCAAWNVAVDPTELALLCQKVENLIAGAPCGVMDQMTAFAGHEGALLALLCQPAELRGHIPLPDDLAVWGIDSGIRHAVSGADYTSVRTGAFMGYRILADLAGLRVRPAGGRSLVRIDDPRWRGYLANVTPDEFAGFKDRIPTDVEGGEFLVRYAGISDPVTWVEAGRRYAVRTPAAHPVHEHARVQAFAALLGQPAAGEVAAATELGRLMHSSHASYSACGLGSDGTDALVAAVRQAGPARGLYGAKITGGGSGGTVAVLGRRDAGAAVTEIADQYARDTGRIVRVFAGSSPGVAAFGPVRLIPQP